MEVEMLEKELPCKAKSLGHLRSFSLIKNLRSLPKVGTQSLWLQAKDLS